MLAESGRLRTAVEEAPERSSRHAGSLTERPEREDIGRQERPQRLIPARLAGAAAVWMGGTFAICYLLLPMARAGLGLSAQALEGVVLVAGSAALSLLGLWAAVTLGLLLKRPTLAPEDGHPQRALVATTSSLLVWATAHNVMPWLMPLGELGGLELLSFLGANILESALFGVMLASLSQTIRGAFTLGMLFQGALLGGYAIMWMV